MTDYLQSILALFEAVFTKDIRMLGPAIADAKQTLLANGDAYFEQIADTFLLFGDPATALKIPLPHVPTGMAAKKSKDAVTVRWDAVLDCNSNPVAGYNIYRASSAAGPFSKINIGLVGDTDFVDTDGVSGMTGGSYYTVSAVDNSGFESVQSMAVKPAAASSSASGIGGCFIITTNQPLPAKAWWMAFILIATFMIARAAQSHKPPKS